jgi:pimeloyl-ACP methyl ester carboxylesterase
MKGIILLILAGFSVSVAQQSNAKITERVVDIPTRSGVTQRFVLLTPEHSVAAVILFAGGHGGLQISAKGSFKWGVNNFLVRSRKHFAENGLMVVVIDAPSDRQSPPYLGRFRQTPEHVADVKALIAWLRQQADIPVWLVGTSRGTQSAAFVATQLVDEGGPDGLVLTSTMLTDNKGRPVPGMNLGKLKIPVLVVHHEQDGCKHCTFSKMPRLMGKLTATQRKQLISFRGGKNRGDPCKPFAYHGFNGLEPDVVQKIAEWIVSN